MKDQEKPEVELDVLDILLDEENEELDGVPAPDDEDDYEEEE